MPKDRYYLPVRNLALQEDSARIETRRVPRSKFLNTWTRKMPFDAGYLYPFLVDEILPGDHMTYDASVMVRISTPIYPYFDNQRVDTFFFFVPNRIIWNHWVNMMGEQDNPADTIAYTTPVTTLPAGGPAVGSLADYMGIPTVGQVTGGVVLSVNALPFRAYNLIWNEWFRDENISNSAANQTNDGPDASTLFSLKYRAKAHDYFTSCLPWPQKFTAPTLPIGSLAPVIGIGGVNRNQTGVGSVNVYETNSGSGTVAYAYQKQLWDAAADNQMYAKMAAASPNANPAIYADLTNVSAVTINALRQAWLIQQLLERDARGGTRYTEHVYEQFGVKSPDARLQRPEYIGGGQSQLTITPIAQTAPPSGGSGPLAALAGAGTAAGMHKASYAATEHGWIIGLINVRTELSYQQGLNRMWTRATRYDYYVPALAELGEQAVTTGEIYCTDGAANDAVVFGYQERWHEYRTRTSEVCGIFRSTAASTLDPWHLAAKFTSAPLLNTTFLQDNPPMTRVLAGGANTVGQTYLADILIHRQAVRPMPGYSTPAQLGRF